jgi:hypothetical protein
MPLFFGRFVGLWVCPHGLGTSCETCHERRRDRAVAFARGLRMPRRGLLRRRFGRAKPGAPPPPPGPTCRACGTEQHPRNTHCRNCGAQMPRPAPPLPQILPTQGAGP